MLNPSEKAYCLALTALRDKRYAEALAQFDKAAPFFEQNQDFVLLREATRLLLAVKSELRQLDPDDTLIIEEVFSSGLIDRP